MNIKILDSWLREYLKTKATHQEIADKLSLTSVSAEKIEPFGKGDWVYDIEVTTNRADLMSVVAIAREAATVLQQFGIKAEFIPPISKEPKEKVANPLKIDIQSNPKLVTRICAVIMEVDLHESPQFIKDRLEASDIRSLNNVIDVTNYIMREIGHPTHVFDYDRLTTKRLEIREARKGEKVETLDHKEHKLPGRDIVADDGLGHIVDLLGVMGTANSVVTDNTKRILFFIDTVEPIHIRHTSMTTGIRTDAAVLNEKGIDPELAYQALLRGIDLYKELANGKLLSPIIDMYPHVPPEKVVVVNQEKINAVIGIDIPIATSVQILTSLGFDVERKDTTLEVIVPSWRKHDVEIPEDIIEEIARIHGYHTLPTVLPAVQPHEYYHQAKNEFYWETRVKNAFKYWGFTEVYTYSMVSEDLLEGPPEEAVKIKNPLSDEWVYMRKTIVPSLLKAVQENQGREEIKIFELANMYEKRKGDLPKEVLILTGVIKKENVSFLEVKGIIETLFEDLGIRNTVFKDTKHGIEGADVFIEKEYLGTIEVLENNLIDFEFNFEDILKHVSISKTYTPISKFPPVIEDIRIKVDPAISFEKIVTLILEQSKLVNNVTLLDVYEDKKTFRIKYQDPEKNLTNEDVTPIRTKITSALEQKLKAKLA